MTNKPDLEKRIAELEKECSDLRAFLHDARAESTMYDQGIRVERERWLNEVVEVLVDASAENSEEIACISLLHGRRVTFKNGREAARYAARVLEVRGTGAVMPWGKFRGKKMGDLPASYAFWLLNEMKQNGMESSPVRRTIRDERHSLVIGAQLYAVFTPPADVERALDLVLSPHEPSENHERPLKWAAQEPHGKYLLAWLGWERCRRTFKVL